MRRKLTSFLIVLPVLLAAGCATTGGPKTVPEENAGVVGTASFYAHHFNGHRTASGAIYDETELTAAHRTLPFGTRVKVTNVENDRSVVVTVNDRGPHNHRRVIDLSRHAAELLGFVETGTAHVHLEVVSSP